MIDDALIVMAKEIAGRHALDGALVCAIIDHESGGDTWAIRYEPAFYAKYIAPMLAAGQIQPAPGTTAETEAMARATSWGLMQMMGETAREAPVNWYGALPALLDPATGIEMGCRKFVALLADATTAAKQLDPEPDEWATAQRALQMYNGGGDPNYGSAVLALVKQYQTSS
jgi:hypothetical protein